jgi:hypothetical protein
LQRGVAITVIMMLVVASRDICMDTDTDSDTVTATQGVSTRPVAQMWPVHAVHRFIRVIKVVTVTVKNIAEPLCAA